MQLETEPSKYLPEVSADKLSDNVVKIDINKPMKEILSTLTKHPIKTRLSLTGPNSVCVGVCVCVCVCVPLPRILSRRGSRWQVSTRCLLALSLYIHINTSIHTCVCMYVSIHKPFEVWSKKNVWRGKYRFFLTEMGEFWTILPIFPHKKRVRYNGGCKAMPHSWRKKKYFCFSPYVYMAKIMGGLK